MCKETVMGRFRAKNKKIWDHNFKKHEPVLQVQSKNCWVVKQEQEKIHNL